jgi:hypothetical protein
MGMQRRPRPLLLTANRGRIHRREVLEEPVTTADLLDKWREATRAAELAQRLAESAIEAAARADRSAVASEEIAQMAERAAEAAARAATAARMAADEATAFAAETRATRVRNAEHVVETARDNEGVARDAYHRAEKEARERSDPRP